MLPAALQTVLDEVIEASAEEGAHLLGRDLHDRLVAMRAALTPRAHEVDVECLQYEAGFKDGLRFHGEHFATPRAYEPAPTADASLHDRVEFALRDAGFNYDEASRIAALTDEPAPTADEDEASAIGYEGDRCDHGLRMDETCNEYGCSRTYSTAPTVEGGAVAWVYAGEIEAARKLLERGMGDGRFDAQTRGAEPGYVPIYTHPAPAPVAAKALEYIYGHIADEVWAEMVEEQATPPWPLEKHLRPMGFYTQQTVHDALVLTIMAHPGDELVDPEEFTAEVIKRMKA